MAAGVAVNPRVPSGCAVSVFGQRECDAASAVVLVQLAPGLDGKPEVQVLGACLDHSASVRLAMEQSWPFDPVTVLPRAKADAGLRRLMRMMAA